MLRDFSSKIRIFEDKYKTVKTINNKSLGITELVQNSSGKLYVKKVLPVVNESYSQLLKHPVAHVAKIVEAIDGFNCGFVFGENY